MAIAQNEIGYLEKKTNACLEDKIANAGAGNFTKYWAVMAPSLQGQPWCQCWINYIFRAAYGDAKAKEMAENYGVSRNAIHKQLKITTDKLQYYEDNLKLRKKSLKLNQLLEDVKDEKLKKELMELF